MITAGPSRLATSIEGDKDPTINPTAEEAWRGCWQRSLIGYGVAAAAAASESKSSGSSSSSSGDGGCAGDRRCGKVRHRPINFTTLSCVPVCW